MKIKEKTYVSEILKEHGDIADIMEIFGVRSRRGNYVLFIVWTNFVTSILYLFAAYGFLKSKRWTTPLLLASEIFLIIAFIGFIIYITSGGIYESKTLGAMIFRIVITLAFLIASYFTITYLERPNNLHANKGNSNVSNKSS